MTSASTTLASLRGPTPPQEAPPTPGRRGLQEMLEDPRVQRGLAAVANKVLNPERVAKLVTNAIYRTPNLALCNPTTVLGALMASVSLGLEPNTPAGHAYLIPYKRSLPRKDANGEIVKDQRGGWLWDEIYECQFQLGYRGLIVLAYRSPKIATIDAEAIHRNDHFEYQKGTGGYLHWALPKDLASPRGPLIGSYCHVNMREGGETFTVMPLEEIHRIRDRSDTYTALKARLEEANRMYAGARDERGKDKARKDLAKAQKTFDETPWVLWEDPMAIKSVIKRHVNQRLPLDPGDMLRLGVDIDNGAERGLIDLSALANPEMARVLQDGHLPPEAITHDDPPKADPAEGAGDDPQTPAGAEGAGDDHGGAAGAPTTPGPHAQDDRHPPSAEPSARSGRSAGRASARKPDPEPKSGAGDLDLN